MRTFAHIFTVALAFSALLSCSKEAIIPDIESEEGSIPFVLNAELSDTKLAFGNDWRLSWERNDIVYAVTTDGEWSTAAPFTYNGTDFTTTKTISNGDHTFNFIYCPFSQKGYHKSTGTTFNITERQARSGSSPMASIKNHYPLAGQATAATPTASIHTSMHHIATIVKVTLKNATGSNLTIKEFTMDMPSSRIAGMFDVVFDGTPRLEYKSGTINYSSVTAAISNGAISAGGELPVYLVIAPLNKYNGVITFTATDNAGKTYSKSAPVVNLTFRAGTYNSATFTLQ